MAREPREMRLSGRESCALLGPWGEGKSDLFQVTSSRDSGATVCAVSKRTDSLNLCLLQCAGR